MAEYKQADGKVRPGFHPDWDKFMIDLKAMQTRAADMHLWVTMRSLNAAERAAGWEKAGNLKQAVKRALDRIDPNGAP